MTPTKQPTKKPTSAHVTGFISGAYLVLVIILAVLFLSHGESVSTTAAAPAENTNQSVTFSVNYVPLAPTISFTAPADGATIEDDEVVLAWESTNAGFEPGQLSATGDWNPSSLQPNGGYTVSGLAAGEYTFTITATDVEGGQATSSTVTVTVSPSSTYQLNDPTTSIDGEPGSTTTVPIRITDTNNFSGSVDISNIIIPTRGDGEGNQSEIFAVTLDDSTLNSPSDTATAEIEVLRPIYDDTAQTIRIQGDAGAGADTEDQAVITINPDAFQPRTIEEF